MNSVIDVAKLICQSLFGNGATRAMPLVQVKITDTHSLEFIDVPIRFYVTNSI